MINFAMKIMAFKYLFNILLSILKFPFKLIISIINLIKKLTKKNNSEID